MQHLISIITPTYNCERHIKECLESVASQNLSEKVQHYVIDGGSTDQTIDIVKKYSDVIYVSEKDEGQSDAFNKGIKLANTDWIVILDGDDIMMPGSLEAYIKMTKKNPDIIYGHSSFIDYESNIIKNTMSINYHKSFVVHDLFIPPSSGLMFRSKLLKENMFNIKHHYNMDTEWFLRMNKPLKSSLISMVTTGFRVWTGSKTYSLTSESEKLPKQIIEERNMLLHYKNDFKAKISKFGIIRIAYAYLLKNYFYLLKFKELIFFKLKNRNF